MNPAVPAPQIPPVWKRLLALAVDFGIVFLTLISLYGLLPFKEIPFLQAFATVFMIYSVLMDIGYEGTVGKLMLKIKVVRTTNARSRTMAAFIRNYVKVYFIFSPLEGLLFLLIAGNLTMLFDEKGRALHDKFAKTRLVNLS